MVALGQRRLRTMSQSSRTMYVSRARSSAVGAPLTVRTPIEDWNLFLPGRCAISRFAQHPVNRTTPCGTNCSAGTSAPTRIKSSPGVSVPRDDPCKDVEAGCTHRWVMPTWWARWCNGANQSYNCQTQRNETTTVWCVFCYTLTAQLYPYKVC